MNSRLFYSTVMLMNCDFQIWMLSVTNKSTQHRDIISSTTKNTAFVKYIFHKTMQGSPHHCCFSKRPNTYIINIKDKDPVLN